jgi:hypothetical protein
MLKDIISLITGKGDRVMQSKLDNFAAGMFLVVMGSGILLAAWLLFQNAAQKAIVADVASAARDGNIYKLKSHADWASIKDDLKKSIKERNVNVAHTNGSKDEAVDELVEYYVRPESLPSLLYEYNSTLKHVDPEAFVRDVRFSGVTEITVEIAPPPQFDKPWMNKLEPVRAVFKLDGLDWKLKKIDAPDYLIPQRAPTPSFKEKGKSS